MMQRCPHSTARAAWLLGGLLTAGLAHAQAVSPAAPADTGEEIAPVYEIELLIFRYNDFNPREEEFRPMRPHWPKRLDGVTLRATPETLQPGSADWYLDNVLLPAATASGGVGADVPATPAASVAARGGPADEQGNTLGEPSAPDPVDDGRWYRLLAPSELTLDRAASRLVALGAYTPLLHTGWSQAALLEGEAEAFQLGWLGRLQPAGSIRLHRSRFLHLTLDVSLQDGYRYRQLPLSADARWPLAEFVGPVRHRIAVQRRVRSGAIHFFDHPAFGVLVLVRPAPDTADADGAEPTGPAA